MNKTSNLGIIVIATTMLGAMLLSSCSHDEYFYSEEKAEQTVYSKYAAAFEKAFGKKRYHHYLIMLKLGCRF